VLDLNMMSRTGCQALAIKSRTIYIWAGGSYVRQTRRANAGRLSVLRRICDGAWVQPCLQAPARAPRPHLSAVRRDDSALGEGRPDRERAWPEAIARVEHPDADAEAAGGPGSHPARARPW